MRLLKKCLIEKNKMKNIIFIVCAFLFCVSSVFAQDIEVGEKFDSKRTIKPEHWQVTTDESNVFIIERSASRASRKLHIRKLDKNLNLVKELEEKIEVEGNPVEFLKAFMFNNKVYILVHRLAATYNTSRGM